MSWLVTFSLNAGRIVFMEILLMMCLGKSYFLFFFFLKAEIVPIIGGCLVCQSCSYFFKNTWKRQRKMLPLPSFTAKHSRQVAEGTSERLGGGARFRDCWLQSEYRRGLRFTFMSLLHRDFYFMCAVFFLFFFRAQKHSVVFGERSQQAEAEEEGRWGWNWVKRRQQVQGGEACAHRWNHTPSIASACWVTVLYKINTRTSKKYYSCQINSHF